MSFNLELLIQELNNYGTVLNCDTFNDNILEIKCKNSIGEQTNYTRIETELITHYFPITKISYFRDGYYKSAFSCIIK